MAIRWNEYRKRRSLIDLSKCFENWEVKNYNDLCKYLWDIGVIPPSECHKDVRHLHQYVDKASLPKPKPKPASGRSSGAVKEISEDASRIVKGKTLQSEKPSSGRSPALTPEPNLKKVKRKASTGTRKKSTATRKRVQKKTSSKSSGK